MQEDKDTLLEKQRVTDASRREFTKLLSGAAFSMHKVTDVPNDDINVVNRRYVNLNGTLANRPAASVATLGQRYFATDVVSGTSITFNGTNWTNGVGSVVALG